MMKTNILSIALVLVLGSVTYGLPLVEWNTVDVGYNIYDGNQVWFSMYTEQSPGSGAGIEGGGEREIDGWWTTLDAETSTVGIAHKWFVVGYEDLIDWDLAESATPFADMLNSEYGSIYLDYDQSIYIGFKTGGADYCPHTEYGWAQLHFDGDTVSVLSSATERTGMGIYAGTGTAIPEPASAGLLLLGAAGIIWKRRRTSGSTLRAASGATVTRDVGHK